MSNPNINENVNYLNDVKNNIKQRKNELLQLKTDLDKYLEKINIKSTREIFDSFLEWNSSDEEDFYEDTSTLSTINSKKKNFSKYPARHLYSTYDDFLSGYENDKYLKRFKALVADEKKQIEKVYIKDLLKLNIDMTNFDYIQKKKYKFNKRMTLNNNLNNINKEKIFNFKSRENKNGEDSFKIMNISGDYNFNYNLLAPYITNTKSIKIEDTSKPIVIHFGKNQSYIFKTVNINDDEKGKKSLYGKLHIEDLFKRAQCLSYDRFQNINRIVLVYRRSSIKYAKQKNEYNKETTNKGIYPNKNKIKEKQKQKSINSVSPKKNFLKVNNEIYTLSELKNYFTEIKNKEKDEEKEEKEKEEKEENKKELKYSEKKEKEFNKREILINNLTDKINGYISNQKNQYHDELKKKVEKLIYPQEGSFNNGDNKSINEMYNMLNLSNSEALLEEADDEDEENTISNEERKNIKLIQNNTEEDLKENIPDILPTYQTLFINGFINKIQKNPKNK